MTTRQNAQNFSICCRLAARRALIALAVVGLSGAACRSRILPPPVHRKTIGEACGNRNECREGFDCTGTCQPSGALQLGESCDITAACGAGLYCAVDQTCQTAGSVQAGGFCSAPEQCDKGLVCSLIGVFPKCQMGGGADLGQACTATLDCLAGLACVSGACASGVSPLAIPAFAGVQCDADSGSFRAYFEVPAAGQGLADFFRLPFPNEARGVLQGGARTINMLGFPAPASGPGGDLVSRFAGLLASDGDGGFGVNQPITMRFSAEVDTTTLRYTGAQTLYFVKLQYGNDPALALDAEGCDTRVDVSSDATKQWRAISVPNVSEWYFNASRTPYVCQNAITFRSRTDNPLEPNALYALLLSSDIASKDGAALAADQDLSAVLGAGAVAGRLQHAQRCYQPLAQALTRGGAGLPAKAKVAGATLFRTQAVREPAQAIVKAVTSAPKLAPRIKSLVKCEAGVVSPCHVEGDASRDCPTTASDVFDEYHGLVAVPRMQSGTRPYATDGGFIEYGAGRARFAGASDAAIIQGSEDVCFALAVPKSAAAPVSLPVVIYGHGTGGNFRGFTQEGPKNASGALDTSRTIAAALTGRASKSMAVLSFDQPMHGPRRGSSEDPDSLYFNLNNPQAARDNVLQALADYLQIAETLKGMQLSTIFEGSDAAAVALFKARLSPTKILFLGHSQGGINGVLFNALSPVPLGAVLSGAGGGFTQAMLGKTQPFDFRALLALVLGETVDDINQFHPVLGLMQAVLERADAINYALNFNPAATQQKSLLQIVGLGDSYTPVRTASDLWAAMHPQPAFSQSSAVEAARPADSFIDQAATAAVALPVLAQDLACNCQVSAGPPATASCDAVTPSTKDASRYTAASVIYQPASGNDGHFVIFDDTKAEGQAAEFLSSIAAAGSGVCGGVAYPTIIAP